MLETLHVGGEIEGYCGSCKETRWHVIVALVGDRPVKVECLSCHKQHGFRSGPAGSPKIALTRPSTKRKVAAPVEPTFDLSMLSSRAHEARAYAPAETFAAGDVLKHPTFGLGIVVALAGPQRIDARFPSGPRVLVHDRKKL